MYAILVEFNDSQSENSQSEIYGPFDALAKAQRFAEEHELGGYSIIEMSSPN